MKEKFPNSRKPSYRRVCGEFWNLRGQHNQEKKQKQNREYVLNRNSQQRSNPDAHIRHQQGVLDRETWAASSVLRVRTRPECPEDNLRELTRDSNPNCGITREREKESERERERENFPVKSSNPRTS